MIYVYISTLMISTISLVEMYSIARAASTCITMTATLLIFFLVGFATARDYEGYKVYQLITENPKQDLFLNGLVQNDNYDFWSQVNKVGKPITVMVSPAEQKTFENNLNLSQITFKTTMQDVKSTLRNEKQQHRVLGKRELSHEEYHSYHEINQYLDELAQEYPKLVNVSSIGNSTEQRDLRTIRISSGARDPPKSVIFIEAGMHAREWISPAVSLYIIDQLLRVENSYLLENVDWIVLPTINPDGYEYTRTTDRLWRKTRSVGVKCNGVDGNRNFGFHWMEAGASDEECSDIFGGNQPFSEPEARNLANALDAIDNIKAFVSLHSYGQYLFYPYSYAQVVPNNYQELQGLAYIMNDAISSVNGTQYTIGSSTQVLYPAAGCSDDWAMGGSGISIVFVLELPGGGWSGFDLPPEKILPVSVETFEGIRVLGEYVGANR